MSDRSAPKEHPKNQPRNPSSLRNQLHDSEIQVPDSQIVIQETQQGGEVMTPASGGDPLSPNSQKLLHRTTQPVVQEQYDMSNEGPVFGLVRPTMVDDPRFIFPPHNSSSKTAAKQENTQGPNSSSRPCIEPPTNSQYPLDSTLTACGITDVFEIFRPSKALPMGKRATRRTKQTCTPLKLRVKRQ